MDEMKNNSKVNIRPQSSVTPVGRRSTRNESMRRYNPNMKQGQSISGQSVRTRTPQANNIVNKASFPKSEKTLSILDRLVSACIFMLFLGLPLFFMNMTYQGISFEKQYYFYLWVFIGVIAWAARGILGGKIEIRKTSLDIPLGIFWLIYVVATIFSVDKYHSFFGFFGNPINGLMSITTIILAYYLIVSFATKKRAMLMWWAIITSGSIITVWSFLVTMRFIPQDVLQYVIPSLTGSFTALAAFLAMMLPMFIISTSLIGNNGKNKIGAKFFIGSLFLATILDLITLSLLFGYVRWYVVMVAIIVLLVFAISRFVFIAQKTAALTVFVFLVLVGFYIYDQPIFTRTTIQPEASLNYGLSLDIVKEAIKSKPFLGSGPGTYGYNFSLYRPIALNQSGQYDIRFFSDRGILMESISTIGIVGAIVLIVVCLSYINNVVHLLMKLGDSEIKIVSLGLFITSGMALLYTLLWSVDGVIVLYGNLIAALTLGLLRSSLSDEGGNKLVLSMSSTPQNALSFAFLSISVAICIIFGFVTLGKMFVADVYAGSALKARAQNNYIESANKFTKAVSFNDKEGRYFTIISQYGLDLANIELAKGEGANKDTIAQYINSAAATANQGRGLMPNDVLANETAGFIYENSGGYVSGALISAMNFYNTARTLEPQNPYLDIAVGKLKLMEAQTQGEDAADQKNNLINEAKTLFEEAKTKTTFGHEGQKISVFAPAHYYIAITSEALGNIDEAIEAMTTALQIAQLDRNLSQQQVLSRKINYGFNLSRLLQIRGTDKDNKNAESLLLQIIGVNDQEINSLLNLALLYERTDRSGKAKEEYKKILQIMPEDDKKSRDNIQGLIDIIEQGGSNVYINQKQDVDDGINIEDEVVEEGDEEEVQKVTLLIIGGKNSAEDTNEGQSILSQEGYESTVRSEDRDLEGVVIMYSGDTDKEEIKIIQQILKKQFNNIKLERKDDEVATYNHDVVVIIGSSKEAEEVNEEG